MRVRRWELGEGSWEKGVGRRELREGSEEMRVGRREWEERKWDMIVGDGSGEISPPPTPSHFL